MKELEQEATLNLNNLGNMIKVWCGLCTFMPVLDSLLLICNNHVLKLVSTK